MSKSDNYKAACEHLIDLVDDNEELNTILNEMTAYNNEMEVQLVHHRSIFNDGQRPWHSNRQSAHYVRSCCCT